jgi:fatty-acyl-CoA synthase
VLTWNLGDLFESVADLAGDREAVVSDVARLSYADLDRRSNQLARHLADLGVGAGDHVALVLRNGHEYLEGMLAAFKLRAVPINVNTRYTTDELRYLLTDAAPTVVIHEAHLADILPAAVADLQPAPVLFDRSSGYEEALTAQPGRRLELARSGDDRYLLYTGGTTGLPKGVVWRHEDLVFSALGGGNADGDPAETPEEVAENARRGRSRCLPASPFTHGTAQWTALSTLLAGGTVVVDTGEHFDAARLLDLAERERASLLVIVGDAFARPLADTLSASPERWALDDLLAILSGGAVLSPTVRQELLELVPWAVVVDGYGTSETGGQGQMPAWAGQDSGALPRFHVDEDTAVLDDGGRPAPPGSGLVGRLARRGRIPLGYHGDPQATADTFVVLDGQRWAIPGDLARVEGDGSITLLGRGASSINSGGEKVFPEEVEMVLKAHPAVFDAVVIGIPDDRFGQRVAAVVQVRAGRTLERSDVERHCRDRLAPFKVPRRLVEVAEVRRHPSGKADLRWALERVLDVSVT